MRIYSSIHSLCSSVAYKIEPFEVSIKGKMTLEQLQSYFTDLLWPVGFGGVLWGHITKDLIGLKKATSIEDKVYYIDHIIDLEHNTGNVFDKNMQLNNMIRRIIQMKSSNNFIQQSINYVYPEIKEFYKKYFYLGRYSAATNINWNQDDHDFTNKQTYDLTFSDLCSFYFIESLPGVAYVEAEKDPELRKIKLFICDKIANAFIKYLNREVHAERATTVDPVAIPGQPVSPELFSLLQKKDIKPELFTVKTSNEIKKPKSKEEAIANLNSRLSKDIAYNYMNSVEKEYLINIIYLIEHGEIEYIFQNNFLADNLTGLITSLRKDDLEYAFYNIYKYLIKNNLLWKYENRISEYYRSNPPEKYLRVKGETRDYNHVKAINDVISKKLPLSDFLGMKNIEFSKQELESVVSSIILNDRINFNNLVLFYYSEFGSRELNTNALTTMFEIIVDRIFKDNPDNLFSFNIINLDYLETHPIVGIYIKKYVKHRLSLNPNLRLKDMLDVFTEDQLYKIDQFLRKK